MSVVSARVASLVLLATLFAVPAVAQAQEKDKPPAAPVASTGGGLNILVVDVQSLLQNSKSAKMVRQQIEQKRAEYAKDITHQEEGLRQERDALQRQQSTLSADALNQKGREFQAKVNELDKNVQGKRQALERSNSEALEKIQEAMLKIITDIAKDRKANLVFQRSELVLFDQAFDVTDEVLQKLDDQLPTLTVNFANPAAAGAPAAAAGAAAPGAATPAAAGTPAQPAPKQPAPAPKKH